MCLLSLGLQNELNSCHSVLLSAFTRERVSNKHNVVRNAVRDQVVVNE